MPSLTTFNGIGPRFVGHRDYDDETASWVATQYFCVLFIPIFAMAAYRIASNRSGGWNLLGKEPISRPARNLNLAILLLVAAAVGGGMWNAHVNSPEYRAGKAIENAAAVRKSGSPDKAMALYEQVLTNSELPRKDEARAAYSVCFDEALATLPLPQKQAAIRAALVARNLTPAPVPDLAGRVLKHVGLAAAGDPAAAAALLKTTLPAVQASESTAYRTVWRSYLEKAVASDPANADPAIDLAVILDAEDKPEECRRLLSPHLAKLGSTDGARVMGQILVRDGKFTEGVPLLKAYASSRLSALHSAEAKYEAMANRIQSEAVATLRENRAGAEFYRKYEAADEASKQEMVDGFIRQRIKDSKAFAAAMAELEAASPVVPVMLSLGIAQLNLAQASPDEQSRKKGLEDAEASFLSVQKAASGTDEYQLFLGQVSYWLGKHDEGRKLFEGFLASKGDLPNKRLMVAGILRQVGALDESRSHSEKAFASATTDEVRHGAAILRSDTFVDLDDRIQWLVRAGNRKEVQISLNEANGHKKETAGDRAGAEELFRKALAGYDDLPRSAATLNNSANVLSSLHSLTRDPKFFREAVNRRDESSRLAGQDTVLMHNLVADWMKLLMMEAAESVEGFDSKSLPSGGAAAVAQMRHRNAEEEAQVIAKYRTSETLRKASATCAQLLVLAPKNPESYSSSEILARLLEDTAAMRSLRDRAVAAKLEHSAHWKEAQKFWKGEKDAEYRRTLHASVAEWTEALKTLPKTAPALSRLACQTVIHSLHASLPHVGETFDPKVLVSEAEVIAAEHPCYGTLRLAQNAHLTAMLEDLAATSHALAAWSKPLVRFLDARDILILAMEQKLLPDGVADNAHFKAWLALRQRILAAYPKKHGASNWALLRHLDPAMAEEERLAAEKDEITLLDVELEWLMNPTSPEHTAAMMWQEQMLNRAGNAAAILKDAIAHGMPLPLPEERPEAGK